MLNILVKAWTYKVRGEIYDSLANTTTTRTTVHALSACAASGFHFSPPKRVLLEGNKYRSNKEFSQPRHQNTSSSSSASKNYYSRLPACRAIASALRRVGWGGAKPGIAPLRVAMRGGDAGAAAEAGSPRSPDLYDLSDDSDYAAAAAAASDHTVLARPHARDELDATLVHLGLLPCAIWGRREWIARLGHWFRRGRGTWMALLLRGGIEL